MWGRVTRCSGVIAGLLIVLLPMGGCWCEFEATLPDDLDAGMKYVLDNRQEFSQASVGGVDTGAVIDDLHGLAGCWGAFLEASGAEYPAGQTESFSLWRLGSDGTLTTWDVVDFGGLFAVVYDGIGSWAVVGDDRLRFTINQRRYFNPLIRQYEVFDGEAEVTEWLATADSDRLYVFMLDAPGAALPEPNDSDYTIVYRRFDCPE